MSKRKRPILLVISLGGTWTMAEQDTPDGQRTELVPERLGPSYQFVEEFPSVAAFADVTFAELASIDSTNMTPADWTTAARYIADRHAPFDGIVVLQGTDTMEFTAPALAFALRGLGKPVVLTGAQVSKSKPGSDAPANIVNACRVAALQDNAGQPIIREVVVTFGSQILRATRCRKYSERDLDAFATVNVPAIGRFGTDIRLNRHLLLPGNGSFQPAVAFDPNVTPITLFPGIHPGLVEAIATESRGIVLAAFGAGNVPAGGDAAERGTALDEVITRLTMGNVPVVVTTRCVVGQAEQGYETGNAARAAGAIIANDMTPECAFVKLSWVLANQDAWPRKAKQAASGGPGWIGAVRTAMLTPMAGEITDNATMAAENFAH